MAYACLLLFFVMEYVRPAVYIPSLEPLHLNLIFPLIAVIAASFPQPRKPGSEGAWDFNAAIVGSIVLLMIVSRFTAFMSDAAQALLEAVVGYAAVAWVITRIVWSVGRLKGIFAVVVVVHAVIMILSPDMLLDPDSRTHTIASGSFLGDGNDFALSLDIAIPMGLFLLFQSKSVAARVLLIPLLLFLVVGVIASQSRGGTLALAAVGLYYWFKSGKSIAMALVVGAAVVVVLTLAPSSYFDRMNTITNPTDGSAQGRINSWKLAWNQALGNPLLGIGAGNTPYMAFQNPHSIYFMMLGELGFPGLFALLAMIIGNFTANRRLLKQCRAGPAYVGQRQILASLSASLIALAIAGAFLSAAYYPHVYVLSGLLSAGRRLVRDQGLTAEAVTPDHSVPDVSYHWTLAPKSRRVV